MPDVARQLERHLRPAQLDLMRQASKVSAEQGVELFLVGGTMRDILSRQQPADLDLVALGDIGDLASALVDELGGEVLAHSQFGTFKLKLHEIVIDLAAARRESYARPGALPTVAPGCMDDDLARRDFSINAIAVSLGEGTFGSLLDPFDGLRDLKGGVVRVLHSQSFVDDATRVLRALRYAHRLGFRLDGETQRLLERDLGRLDTISGDRLRHELERFFMEPRAAGLLRTAQDLGTLTAIHPSLSIDPAALARLETAAEEPTPESALRHLAFLVYAVPAESRPDVIGRLNMDRRWARVVGDVGSVRDAFQRLREPNLRPSEVFGLLRHLDVASIGGCSLATDDPLVKKRLELYLKELRHVKPLLNGNDLIALGVPEGPAVGELLGKILTARLEGLLSTREDEENLVRRSL